MVLFSPQVLIYSALFFIESLYTIEKVMIVLRETELNITDEGEVQEINKAELRNKLLDKLLLLLCSLSLFD